MNSSISSFSVCATQPSACARLLRGSLPEDTMKSIRVLIRHYMGQCSSSRCCTLLSKTEHITNKSRCIHTAIYEIMCLFLINPSSNVNQITSLNRISFTIQPITETLNQKNLKTFFSLFMLAASSKKTIIQSCSVEKSPQRLSFVLHLANTALQKPPTRASISWSATIRKVRSIVRVLREPSDEKPVEGIHIPPPTHMHESRWLERLDHLNRNGGDLEKQWKLWQQQETFTDEKERKYFFTWLARQPGNKQIPPVRYLRPVDRPFCKLIIKDGVCSTLVNGGVLHTLDDDQPHIFAWTTTMSVLIDLYNRGFSHHSCVVSGAPVLAAGEMIFSKKGILKRMTDKSGHYRTTRDPFIEFVYFLSKKGINMTHVKIALDCVKEPYTKENDFRGGELLELRKKRLAEKQTEQKI